MGAQYVAAHFYRPEREMWLTVKINWGLYTQLKSTVNRFIPPKETHRPEMLIALKATSGKRNKLHPDVCEEKGANLMK